MPQGPRPEVPPSSRLPVLRDVLGGSPVRWAFVSLINENLTKF